MFELTPQGVLAMGMVMVGDLLAIAAVLVAAVVMVSILATAVSRVSFKEILKYWILSLVLVVLLGGGIVAKAGSASLAAEPNGLLIGFSNSTIVTLLGIAVFCLLGGGGLLVYILNK